MTDNKKKKGLGRGLSSLLSDVSAPQGASGSDAMVPITAIWFWAALRSAMIDSRCRHVVSVCVHLVDKPECYVMHVRDVRTYQSDADVTRRQVPADESHRGC